jgi:hypothetical protein
MSNLNNSIVNSGSITPGSKKRTLKKYSIEKKLEIVAYAKRNSNHAAGKL